MGSVSENLRYWSSYEWSDAGDEWSKAWGGTEYLWWGTIFPRIRAFVPTGTILEIAPGYGRCTLYLKDLCEKLIVVDIAENCIAACRERFASCSHIEYFVNDGRSLEMIENDSVDFVFSWDSLVHAESEVLRSYLEHLAAKLKPGGYGFIHHSNIGAFKNGETQELTVENRHWRGESMSAGLFRQYCDEVGLTCLAHEIVTWGCADLTDSFSVFIRGNIPGYGQPLVFENTEFGSEAARLKKLSELYDLQTLYERRGAQLVENESPDEAGAYFEQVLRLHPAAAALRYRYALLLHAAGKTREAVGQLTELVGVLPDNARAHNDIGALYYELGEKDKARSHLQRAVVLDEKDLTARKNLADLCAELGRTRDAVDHYQAILSQCPNDTDALFALANICTELGRAEKAAIFYRQILAIDPKNGRAREKLAGLGNAFLTGRASNPHVSVKAHAIGSYEAYKNHVVSLQDEYVARERYERSFIENSKPFTVPGYCYVCKRNIRFGVDYFYSYEVNGVLMPNWRERLVCPSCGLINRMRASIHFFEHLLEPSREGVIFMAEQTTPVYGWFAESYRHVVGSEYLADAVPFGETDENGIRNETLTGLSFSDEEFDYVLTFDVFEHIADFQKALRECYRVLKSTGTLFFTVPFNVNARNNGVRARIGDQKEIEHLLPPEHHGPWLVFNQFGWEMLDKLRQAGFASANAYVFWSKEFGYLGREQTVFVAKKDAE
jgi:tetratricopeptide (TPR) repeat protein/ubiquinone/menaquinone biosynthesis C-methylase UbiE